MIYFRKPKSYALRGRKFKENMESQFHDLWQRYGIDLVSCLPHDVKNWDAVGAILEIGFGYGDALLLDAKLCPNNHYLGIEVYRPGILALLRGLFREGISNVRVFHADAIEVLTKCIPDASLKEVRLFFPDPWPKRRHHGRRLVQNDFLNLLHAKLQVSGIFHFVTDWEDYASHVRDIFKKRCDFAELEVPYSAIYASGKFARKGVAAGRNIFEFLYVKS